MADSRHFENVFVIYIRTAIIKQQI